MSTESETFGIAHGQFCWICLSRPNRSKNRKNVGIAKKAQRPHNHSAVAPFINRIAILGYISCVMAQIFMTSSRIFMTEWPVLLCVSWFSREVWLMLNQSNVAKLASPHSVVIERNVFSTCNRSRGDVYLTNLRSTVNRPLHHRMKIHKIPRQFNKRIGCVSQWF